MKYALASFAAVFLLAALLFFKPEKQSDRHGMPILVCCAAGIKTPVEEIMRDYERETGRKVQLQYGGSGTLLNNIEISRTGDLYLVADAEYLEVARKKGLVDKTIPLAMQRPVLVVRASNPKKIYAISDLLRKDVRVALANPEATSIGKQVRKYLKASGEWDALEKAVTERGVFKPTVSDLANDIKIGIVDACFIWDGMLQLYPELEPVDIPVFKNANEQIGVAVLKFAKNPDAALHFARYLGARDRGLKVFKKNGYRPVAGDAWVDCSSGTAK